MTTNAASANENLEISPEIHARVSRYEARMKLAIDMERVVNNLASNNLLATEHKKTLGELSTLIAEIRNCVCIGGAIKGSHDRKVMEERLIRVVFGE